MVAGMKLGVKFDSRGLKRYHKELGDSGLRRIGAKAINAGMGPQKRRIVATVAMKLGVPQKVIRPRLTKLLRAKARHWSAAYYAHGHPLRWKDGVTYKPSKGGVSVGGVKYQDAFFAEMPSGHRGWFQREGQSRTPIKEVTTKMIDAMLRALTEAELRAGGEMLRALPGIANKEIARLQAKHQK